ncbi:alpha/beta hydrolase [Laceyella putida]|uniref:Alpha/beta hydrolase n=1 Tax=Laceyella putida TaxID=110101 RepID=A0ABW2RI22_9BACL
MKRVSFTFLSTDDMKIHVNKWLSQDQVKGVVQIAHGMSEHSERYGEFATALTEAGYHVYANDHRGFGKTAEMGGDVGHFADENGWELAVNDLYQLTRVIKKEMSGLPLFLFGHSMGSFLSRAYIQRYGRELAGVILSGTGSDRGVLSSLGILIAQLESKVRGKRARSRLLNQLSFGNFNKRFRPNRTSFDWLSRDTEAVDKYVQDPLCGEIPTAGFFYDLFTGIKQLERREGLAQVPPELPILLFAGDRDPVGQDGKAVLKTHRQFKQVGIKDLSLKLYEGGRHEMLNETNREEVYKDIIAWLDAKVDRVNNQFSSLS